MMKVLKHGKGKSFGLLSALLMSQMVFAENGLLQEVWYDAPAYSISEMMEQSNGSRSDLTDVIPSVSMPVERSEGSVFKLSGYLTPEETESYTFYLNTEQEAEVYLSVGESTVNITQILKASSNAPWRAYGYQKSIPIRLKAGERYYIEILGQDVDATTNALELSWSTITSPEPVTIDSKYFTPFNENGQVTNLAKL